MGLLTRTSLCFILMVLIQRQTVAFKIFLSSSVTHGEKTRSAILNATLQACKEQALQQGNDFVEPKTLTEESLVAACSSADSAKGFKRTISKIRNRNAWVDIYYVFKAKYHFDDESFLNGRDFITSGTSIVKTSVKQQNYETAREKLGEILHTVQDFYSHSNWIELGNTRPYSNLIKPNTKIENIADSETCRSCVGNDCSNNILGYIITEKKLTSGYFNLFSSSKPKGKCSHGGFFDRTKRTDPKGGINKDDITSEHGNLHNQAAGIATAASTELLEDIRAAIGDSEFLRLLNGVSQSSNQTNGAVGIIQMVGNFQTVRPNISDLAGVWLISVDSEEPYTIKAFGKSPLDFLFDFVEISDTYESYAVLNSRPAADSNLTLIVSIVGGDTVRPTEVALIGASNSNAYIGTLKEVAFALFLATFESVPAGEFFVRVTGMNTSKASNGLFQRQSSIQLQASSIKVTTQAPESLEPGKTLTLPFTVSTTGSGGNFSISVSNDRSFTVINVPESLTLEDQGSAHGTINLPVPGNTPSGSSVTLTIEAAAPEGKDVNYAVLRLAVSAPVTDITPPVCEVVSINANCTGNCSLSSWELLVNMSDKNDLGIQSVTIRQGVGSLNTSSVLDQGVNITMAFYRASCCFPQVELVMVDAEGNVGLCFKSLDASEVGNGAEHHLVLPNFFWLNVGIILLYQFM
ncbi:uncharacterized protein [Hoplias malabaricus]|uniref:uncharacterized protein n=1 Tax=Hoplias malabaricus TaxID=27720 RepID=UPI0034625967